MDEINSLETQIQEAKTDLDASPHPLHRNRIG